LPDCRENLPSFGYSEADITTICGMIMATRIPQSPANLLESILCDADLDYLGRDDFKKIGQTLFEEFTEYSILHDEQAWNRLQVSFLSVAPVPYRNQQDPARAGKTPLSGRTKGIGSHLPIEYEPAV
jgi:hypothetical protein